MEFPKKAGAKSPSRYTQKPQLTLFAERTRTTSFDWREVDDRMLRTALGAALSAGAMLGFSKASGGAGVMLKVWHGEAMASEFAANAGELNELLQFVIGHMASSAEDVWEMYGRPEEKAAEQQAAD